MEPFEFRRSARTRTTALVVAGIWVGILLAIAFLDASFVLMTILALFTAPSLYDLMANRQSGLRIDEDGLHWFTGRRTGEIGWSKIDHVRLDTRLDFSVRASAVLTSGRKIRLPMESVPKSEILEDALSIRGILVKRHHFSLLG